MPLVCVLPCCGQLTACAQEKSQLQDETQKLLDAQNHLQAQLADSLQEVATVSALQASFVAMETRDVVARETRAIAREDTNLYSELLFLFLCSLTCSVCI